MGDTAESRIGEEIAGYRIESVLARAGTGVVYLAEDTSLKRKVALKLVAAELAADERLRERFLREAKLAAALDHPNILPIYEVGESDGRLFIAMPLVEGEELARLLAREGRLEPERALLLVTQLASALDTARWSRGLVHGSLKPSDVLLAQGADTAAGERVFLRGFGLRQELPAEATLADASPHFDTIVYLAPEQIEGRPASPRSDVYALGCLLFHCLTGEPPFQGDSAEALLKAHLHAQPPSLRRYCPDLPAAIERVLEKALAKWPEERYSTCEELAACAQAALAPGGEQSERPSREEPFSPLALPSRPERVLPEELPAAQAPAGGSVLAPASLAQRLRKSRGKSIAAIGLVALFAALAAGAIWLTARDPDAVSSATPAPPDAETPNQVDVVEGEGTAELPAQAESSVTPAEGSLVRLDAATGEVVATVALPGNPEFGLLAADDRHVWVVDDRRTLSRIDPVSNDVSETFDVPAGGRWSLAAAGGDVWLTRQLPVLLGPGFEVMRLAAGADALESVDLPGGPWPVVSGGSLWVAVGLTEEDQGRHLLRLDPQTGRVLARLEHIFGHLIAGEGFLWAFPFDSQGDFVRVDTVTNKTTVLTEVPRITGFFDDRSDPPVQAAAGEGSVWVLDSSSGTVVGLDPVTGRVRDKIRVGPQGEIVAGSGAVWLADWGSHVLRYDLTTRHVQTIDVGGRLVSLAIAGDSVWVAVDTEPEESVDPLISAPSVPEVDYVIDLNTGVTTPLPEAIIRSVAKPGESTDGAPRYAASPDGSLLAYVGTGEEGSLQIFIAGIDGTGVRQVTHDPTGATSPAFSRDGTLIAYQGYGEGGVRNLFVLDVATGESTPITEAGRVLPWSQPSFTPDGSSLLYTGGSTSLPVLRTVPVAGGESTLLFGDGRGGMADAGNGSLSPDGSLVTMMGSEIGGPGAIRFVANADGTELRFIPGELAGSNPAGTWSPDGSRIVCSDYDGKDIIVVDIATGAASLVAKGNGAIWLDRHTLLVEVV